MKIPINYKNRKIKLEAKNCNWLKKISGLMFCRRRKAEALLFEFPKNTRMAIHSWFVFFPFMAVWLDDKNEIIEKKIVNPFRFSIRPNKKYVSLVEIPLNDKYKSIWEFLCSEPRTGD
ncbi:DUF192 domain-containing protein [Candidatus Pacearchaeota archaeon]|nr:DUF192 domain-containing protein [Candidatus Pacearchaeota archaeon]